MVSGIDEERVPALPPQTLPRDVGQVAPTGVRVLAAVFGGVALLGLTAAVAVKQGHTVATVAATTPTPLARWDIGGIFGALEDIRHDKKEAAAIAEQQRGTPSAQQAAPEKERPSRLANHSAVLAATTAAPKSKISTSASAGAAVHRDTPMPKRPANSSSSAPTVVHNTSSSEASSKEMGGKDVESGTATGRSNSGNEVVGAAVHRDTPIHERSGNSSSDEHEGKPPRPTSVAPTLVAPTDFHNKTNRSKATSEEIDSKDVASDEAVGDKKSNSNCQGGSLAACQCLFACKIFGGQPSQCSGSKVELLDSLVQQTLQSVETACLGMQCIVRCAKTLGCYEEKLQNDCWKVANQSRWRFSDQSNQSKFLGKFRKHDHDRCSYECEADDVDIMVK